MSAIDWTAAQGALADAVAAALPTCAVAWMYQGPMPAKPCALMHLTVRDQTQGLRGADERQPTATPGVVVHAYHRRHVLSVTVYSDTVTGAGTAPALLAALPRVLQSAPVALALRKAGCKAWPMGDVADLSAMLDTRGESRANLTVAVSTLDTATETIGWIETVDLSGVDVR